MDKNEIEFTLPQDVVDFVTAATIGFAAGGGLHKSVELFTGGRVAMNLEELIGGTSVAVTGLTLLALVRSRKAK